MIIENKWILFNSEYFTWNTTSPRKQTCPTQTTKLLYFDFWKTWQPNLVVWCNYCILQARTKELLSQPMSIIIPLKNRNKHITELNILWFCHIFKVCLSTKTTTTNHNLLLERPCLLPRVHWHRIYSQLEHGTGTRSPLSGLTPCAWSLSARRTPWPMLAYWSHASQGCNQWSGCLRHHQEGSKRGWHHCCRDERPRGGVRR